MNEIYGNIFFQHDGWIGIPTNGDLDSKGRAVMGKGIAAQAAKYVQELPAALGQMISAYRCGVFFFVFERKIDFPPDKDGSFFSIFAFWRFVTLPTKTHWHDQKADIELIEASMSCLLSHAHAVYPSRFYIPYLGCGKGTGNLNWSEVRPVLEKYIGDDPRFTIVTLPEKK